MQFVKLFALVFFLIKLNVSILYSLSFLGSNCMLTSQEMKCFVHLFVVNSNKWTAQQYGSLHTNTQQYQYQSLHLL